MSANNYLSIELRTRKATAKWSVWERNADTGEGHVVKLFKTRDEAIDWASDNLNYIEYGISHIDKLQPHKDLSKEGK